MSERDQRDPSGSRRASEDRPSRPDSGGNRPFRGVSRDDRPVNREPRQGDRPVSREPRRDDRPFNPRPQGDRPVSREPRQGDRPRRDDRPQGERPVSREPRRDDENPFNRPRRDGDNPFNQPRQRDRRPEPHPDREPAGERPRPKREEPRRRPPLDARDVAFETLTDLEEHDAFLQPSLDAVARRAELDPRDRALALELVMGVMRWQSRLDFALASKLQRGLSATPAPLLRILRLAAYQLLFLDRVPARAAVFAAVDQARRRGGEPAARFTNGVLRALAREPNPPLPEGTDAQSLAIRTGHPAWLLERWLAEEGLERTLARAEANNRPAPLTLRPDRPGLTREALAHRLQAEGGQTALTPFAEDGLILTEHPAPFLGQVFRDGDFTAQDEAAQVVVSLLDAHPGESIWDACAAPGGKTRYLALKMAGQGRLLATELDPGRADRLRDTLAGLPWVETRQQDATSVPDERFDRVLLDAPCSGLGTLRRHPEIRWRRSVADIAECAARQADLLTACAETVKPGGLLVYSVCTDTPEEGPLQVERFLASHPDFALEPGERAQAYGPLLDERGFLKADPARHGTDGFFAARLRRR